MEDLQFMMSNWDRSHNHLLQFVMILLDQCMKFRYKYTVDHKIFTIFAEQNSFTASLLSYIFLVNVTSVTSWAIRFKHYMP